MVQARIFGRAVHDGRLDKAAAGKVALGPGASAGKDPPFPLGQPHRASVFLHRRNVDERAQKRVPRSRVADLEPLGFCDELFDERLVDVFVQVKPRAGGTFLTAHPEGRAHDPFGGVVEVGRGHDDGRVFAAHFRDARLRDRLREMMIDLQTDRLGAGENEPVDIRVGDESGAGGVARSGDEVEHSRRQSGIAQHFVEAKPGERGVAGRLENDGIAGEQRARGHARGQREREVERRDDGPDAVGFEHVAGMLDAGAVHRLFVTVVFLHLPGVVENQVDGFRNFGDGFEAVLADFEAEQRGEFKLALRHQLGGFAQQRHALPPAKVAPCGENGFGRGDGFAGIVPAAKLKFAQQHMGIGGRSVGERAVPRSLRLAFDKQRMRGAQFVPNLPERRIKCLMKIFSE